MQVFIGENSGLFLRVSNGPAFLHPQYPCNSHQGDYLPENSVAAGSSRNIYPSEYSTTCMTSSGSGLFPWLSRGPCSYTCHLFEPGNLLNSSPILRLLNSWSVLQGILKLLLNQTGMPFPGKTIPIPSSIHPARDVYPLIPLLFLWY